MFADAPVFRHYTKAMYYRLLAYELLPPDLDRILYLDPDILIINPIRPLYETDILTYLFAGAIHTRITRFSEHINRVRRHEKELILPDQDILNALFGMKTLPLDDSLYNYDTRRYDTYRLMSAGEKDMDWVMQNTVILHFCGTTKPWQRKYTHRFGILYKHYMRLSNTRV